MKLIDHRLVTLMELPEKAAVATYDDKDRALIRRMLREYMRKHGIGSPTLQKRIEAATDREINNKTLQRFLGETKRTDDANVWLYHKFLTGEDMSDPVRDFGNAACEFIETSEGEETLQNFAGRFQIFAKPGGAPKSADAAETFAHSTMTLEAVPDSSFLRVNEHVTDMGGKFRIMGETTKPIRHEGVAYLQPTGLLIVLRDVQTGLQKTYNIGAVPEKEEGRPGLVIATTLPKPGSWKTGILGVRMMPLEEAAS